MYYCKLLLLFLWFCQFGIKLILYIWLKFYYSISPLLFVFLINDLHFKKNVFLLLKYLLLEHDICKFILWSAVYILHVLRLLSFIVVRRRSNCRHMERIRLLRPTIFILYAQYWHDLSWDRLYITHTFNSFLTAIRHHWILMYCNFYES